MIEHKMRAALDAANAMVGSSRSASTGLALAYMLFSTVLLASMHGLIRSLSADLHPFVIVFFRNFLGLVAIMPLLFRAGFSSLKTNKQGLYTIRAIIGLLAMLSWFFALSKVPITHATALSFSTTIFATLSAWLFLGEKMRIRRWAAILVGITGVLVVLRPDMAGFNVYSLLVVVSAVAWGGAISIVKHLSQTETVTSIVGWMGISLTLLSIVPAMYYWQTPTFPQFVVLCVIGILATGGHLLMTSALQMADTAVVMSMDFFRLVWTAIIGSVFFTELLDMWTVLGACIIFAAGWYIIFRESQIE
jgi:drug/metabolite transporter (DMT)-like permease